MRQKNYLYGKRKHSGIALVATLIFILVFMAMSAGMLSMSSHNAIAASNLKAGNLARSTAESGLEMVRYWMKDVAISGSVSESNRYGYLIGGLQDALDAANVDWVYDADTGQLTIGSLESPIVLDAATGRSFYAEVASNGIYGANIQINGRAGRLSRALHAGFTYGTRPQSVFDFGVATKGPLRLKGGTLTGFEFRSESDVYIESFNEVEAIGILLNKSEIAGNVKIVNPNAIVTPDMIKGSIGGLTGEDAIRENVEIGVTPTEFPYPDAAHFKQYATGGYYTSGTTLENMVIKAGTNPKFAGGTTITGILYIESPNVVEFTGNVTVKGMIVAEGDWDDNSATNKLNFTGSVDSQVLPADTKFDAMRNETGTFVMAPGYALTFGGSFGTINGVIAGNGIEFNGNAGGTVAGSIINYSDTTMNVDGSSDIVFNRSGITELPSGFVQEVVIHYNPASYSEVCGQ